MNLAIYRVLALPQVLAPSAMYVVQATEADLAKLYFTNSAGTAVRHTLDKDDVTALIAAAELPDNGVVAGEYAVVTVNAKGIVTAARALTADDVPSLPGSKIISELSVDTTGNAATATLAEKATLADKATTADKLTVGRTINGVDFDGSQNIEINAVDSTARIAVSEKGQAGGVATLDQDGKIPTVQLPSYVDDVEEYASFAELPAQGERGKIYVTTDTNSTYRWADTVYVAIPGGVGTADEALKLRTPRSITATGDVSFTTNFDGSANVSAAATLSATGIEAGEYTVATFDAKGRATGGRDLVAGDIPELDSTKVVSAAAIALVASEW